jgi:hypothetical protein
MVGQGAGMKKGGWSRKERREMWHREEGGKINYMRSAKGASDILDLNYQQEGMK